MNTGPLKHGHTRADGYRSPTYYSWSAMISRCRQVGHPTWQQYGARGIKVCDRWLSFENFLADMGLRPEGTSIDRIDNDGDYEPSNCRWATRREQQNNRRRTIRLTINGTTKAIADWARQVGVSSLCLKYRFSIGLRGSDLLRPSRRKRTTSP